MPDNGKLIIKIDGDDSQLSNRLTGVGRVASKSLNVAIKGAAALGAAFTATSGVALKFSGDLEQNIGGSEAVFERFAGVVQDKSKSAFKTAGLSASNFLATANKMGSLFQGAGFEVEKSANMATDAIQRAADVASIMGLDINFAMESVAGMAKGNFTMMDNLGVAMNDTTLQAYAQEKGLGKLSTTYDKVNAAMLMFMEKTEKYAGNYEKENKTIAGAINTAKAALQNFISGTGTVEELSDALTNAAQVAVENIGKLAPKLAEGLGGLITSMIPMIPPLLKELIPAIVDTIEELFAEAIGIIPELIIAIASGIGEAIPVIKPLADIIEALANNLDVLTVAVVACTGAYIAYNTVLIGGAIIKKIATWHAATKIVMQEYTAAVIANSAATTRGITINGLLLSTMKPLQVIYGVLTGKIKLADAAQKLLNTTILKNPYAWAAALLAALVAGLVVYAATHKSASKEIMESLDDIKQSHDDAIKSIEKTQTAELAEAETAKVLRDRLFELDSQIKSGTLSKEEAKIAQENFNIAAEKLNEMIPGITSSIYNETGAIDVQYDSVNKLVGSYYELAVAKATAAAAEEKMKETAKSLLDARVAQKTAADNYKNALTSYSQEMNTSARARLLSALGWDVAGVQSAKKANDEAWQTATDYAQEQKDFEAIWEEAQRQYKSLAGNRIEEDKKNNGKIVTSTQNTAKKQTEILKKQYEEELSALNHKLDMQKISEEEYFGELEKIRDKYCDEDSEEWREHTIAIYKFKQEQRDKALEKEIADLKNAKKSGIITEEEYLKELDACRDRYLKESRKAWEEHYDLLAKEINEEVKSLSDKLLGKKTTYTTISFEWEGKVEEHARLGDGGYKASQLEKYNSMLDNLYERMKVPPELLFENLAEMSLDERINYMDAILKSTDEEFDAYMELLQKEQNLADEAAKKELLGVKEQLAEQIKKDFGEEIPQGFFDVGKNSAIEFGNGFKEHLDNIMSSLKSSVNDLLSTYKADLGIADAGLSGGNTYYDYRSTNITVPYTSVRAGIESVKQANLYQDHTTSFGGK